MAQTPADGQIGRKTYTAEIISIDLSRAFLDESCDTVQHETIENAFYGASGMPVTQEGLSQYTQLWLSGQDGHFTGVSCANSVDGTLYGSGKSGDSQAQKRAFFVEYFASLVSIEATVKDITDYLEAIDDLTEKRDEAQTRLANIEVRQDTVRTDTEAALVDAGMEQGNAEKAAAGAQALARLDIGIEHAQEQVDTTKAELAEELEAAEEAAAEAAVSPEELNEKRIALGNALYELEIDHEAIAEAEKDWIDLGADLWNDLFGSEEEPTYPPRIMTMENIPGLEDTGRHVIYEDRGRYYARPFGHDWIEIKGDALDRIAALEKDGWSAVEVDRKSPLDLDDPDIQRALSYEHAYHELMQAQNGETSSGNSESVIALQKELRGHEAELQRLLVARDIIVAELAELTDGNKSHEKIVEEARVEHRDLWKERDAIDIEIAELNESIKATHQARELMGDKEFTNQLEAAYPEEGGSMEAAEVRKLVEDALAERSGSDGQVSEALLGNITGLVIDRLKQEGINVRGETAPSIETAAETGVQRSFAGTVFKDGEQLAPTWARQNTTVAYTGSIAAGNTGAGTFEFDKNAGPELTDGNS